MNGSIINQNVESGVFKKYYDGYYQFVMDNEEIIVFEEVSPNVIRKFDLKSDRFKDKSFEITYSEYIEDDDEDLVSFRIEKLKLI
ncbi:hypothetical protein D1816_01050 [Aquimarina sp. AD10]|uniref:Uncharacterized protein n=1 Tax=Aquimarina aggregata TaxID=1642818 RepID=A0A162FDB6_9FLAO|nr:MULTISPECIES: hypothetical protein [Aquimarina]AXT58994.1 hypothetical protein D1816_01050 [Aquimarina sp. AD10]KZS41576.1 hypothetical protein AWE51_21455 [Aquimarina aggregata]RKM95089.1 hypothetical protein D7033_17515 [Aquimarina sp. AD10]